MDSKTLARPAKLMHDVFKADTKVLLLPLLPGPLDTQICRVLHL